MNRRSFLAAGLGGSLAAATSTPALSQIPPAHNVAPGSRARRLFPRLERDVFLNAAAGTPLGTFAEAGLKRYQDYWRLGPQSGRRAYVDEMLGEIRGSFGRLIGAQAEEIALVHCTKDGEQIVLDSLPAIRAGGNVVSNDLHFSGSLHNLVGLRKSGLDIRIVPSRDWDVSLKDMEAVVDDRTALVAVTLVSNVNGRVEPLRELAELAHRRGAYVYADIIQAAGILPFDVRSLGIDFAACSGYKWLFGPHGVGFLYVARELQGTVLPDRLFPGHVGHNYPPWVDTPEPPEIDFHYRPPTDARRYQPGHVSYLGYSALYEGLKFLQELGVEEIRRHALKLSKRFVERLDQDRYRVVSPHLEQTPIVTFKAQKAAELQSRLRQAQVFIAASSNRLRVSPALYNVEEDVDRLSELLNQF